MLSSTRWLPPQPQQHDGNRPTAGARNGGVTRRSPPRIRTRRRASADRGSEERERFAAESAADMHPQTSVSPKTHHESKPQQPRQTGKTNRGSGGRLSEGRGGTAAAAAEKRREQGGGRGGSKAPTRRPTPPPPPRPTRRRRKAQTAPASAPATTRRQPPNRGSEERERFAAESAADTHPQTSVSRPRERGAGAFRGGVRRVYAPAPERQPNRGSEERGRYAAESAADTHPQTSVSPTAGARSGGVTRRSPPRIRTRTGASAEWSCNVVVMEL